MTSAYDRRSSKREEDNPILTVFEQDIEEILPQVSVSSPGRRSSISEVFPDFENAFSAEDLIQVEQYLKRRHGLIVEPQILRSFKKKGGKRMK